ASPMMIHLPRAASIPPLNALPYPFSLTGTSRAPPFLAISMDPSVLPLSATSTSPLMPACSRPSPAFCMQVANVSASFKQGITMVNSTSWSDAAGLEVVELSRSRVGVGEFCTETVFDNYDPLHHKQKLAAS